MKKVLILFIILAVTQLVISCSKGNRTQDGRTLYAYTVIEAPTLSQPVTVEGTYCSNCYLLRKECGMQFIDIQGIEYRCMLNVTWKVIESTQKLPVVKPIGYRRCGCGC